MPPWAIAVVPALKTCVTAHSSLKYLPLVCAKAMSMMCKSPKKRRITALNNVVTLKNLFMLLRELQDIRSTLNKVAEQFGASRLRVFGSVARGEETAASDVDFLVELPKGYDLFSQRIPLAQRLSELLNRRV